MPLGLGLAAAALIGLAACEGDNLFSGDSSLAQPRASVNGPEVVLAGDTFQVRVDGVAARGVARIDVSLRGALTRDTSVQITTTTTSTSQVFKFAAPNFFADTLLVIGARVTDAKGFTSNVVADTVQAFGPPGVVSVTKPDSVRAGQLATVRVRVIGSRRITRIDLNVRGAMTLDSTIAVTPPRFDVTQDIALRLPTTASDTLLRIGINARDEAGLSGAPLTVLVPLSVDPPIAVLTAPASASPGGTLDLRVRGVAMRQVASLKVELRGAVTKDTTVRIDPPRGDVTQDISIRLPGDIQDPTLTVRAFAIDRAGVVSAAATSSTATVTIPLGAPAILSLTSNAETRGGQTYDVRVVARGVRPLARIEVRFRGAATQDLSFTVNPQRTDVTQDASVAIPQVVADTTLVITATAIDVSGAVSPIATRTARVVDVTAPTVSATVNPGQASAGRTVSVRVTASDNVGLSRFGFAAVTNAGDTIGITPTLATTRGTSRDSVFSFAVPATLTPTTLRVVGIAYDAQGLRSTSSAASLVVTDSAMPTVAISDPVDNSSFPLSGQVLVRARVADASGIRRVTFKGIAIRRDSASDARVVNRYSEVVVQFPQPPSLALPRDTTLVRFLTPIPGDNTAEVVNIVVLAEDSLGNVASDTNRVTVGGPVVDLRNPVNGSQVQTSGTFQITAEARDPQVGLDSMKVYLTGAITDSIVVKGLNGATTNLIDVPYTVGTTTGIVNIVSRAWNRTRIQGASPVSSITITSTSVADTQAPQLSILVAAPERAEVDDDTIRVTVRAQDVGSSGVARIGVVMIAIPDTTNGAVPVIRRDTIYVDRTYAPARAGGIEETFRLSLDDFLIEGTATARFGENSELRFPRRFSLEIHAFAIDGAGNCGAATGTTTQSLTCGATLTPPAPVPNTFRLAAGATGFQLQVTGVLGLSIRLPAGGTIADAVVDPRRSMMYMSNISLNRLEFLNLSTNAFMNLGGTFGLVGSAPWGLSFNANNTCTNPPACTAFVGAATRDTLIVANSGGTNLSFIPIEQTLGNWGREDTGRRLNTPNTVVFDVLVGVANARIRYTKRDIDFSDRPQFIGVRSDNIITYSTVPTGSAPNGTIRYVDPNPNPGAAVPNDNRPEVKLLFNQSAVQSVSDAFAIANVDSLKVYAGGTSDDLTEFFDHLPGRWDDVPPPALPACYTVPAPPVGPPPYAAVVPPAGTRCIRSGAYPIEIAIAQMERVGSDIRVFAGIWRPNRVGLSDTTFVAVSDDRSTVAFGEGATNPTGRIMLCCTRNYTPPAPPPAEGLVLGVSQEIAVSDLINNASERVLGLGLNRNGSLGVARGVNAAYFFTRDLRLQGQFTSGVASGGGGAALHPDHASVTTSDPLTTLAFVPTNQRTIKIINTVHFFQSGEIPIRDNVVGPLRAVRPYPADNGALPATDKNYVFVKLVGVTEGGQVVVVNVRRKDVGL